MNIYRHVCRDHGGLSKTTHNLVLSDLSYEVGCRVLRGSWAGARGKCRQGRDDICESGITRDRRKATERPSTRKEPFPTEGAPI
jgi:hypothetical protein